MAFPPEAFLIGAEKAGTTTLLFLFEQHPGITVSNPRVTDFFTAHHERGLDWYRGLFDGPEKTIYLDGTRGYSAARLGGLTGPDESAAGQPDVPGRIHAVNPRARFIYILRDPLARTYSSYWQWVRDGRETRPFREAVRADPIYLDRSDYLGQIERYLVHFPLEAFKFIIFEDLAKRPLEIARECVAFLGAEPADHPFVLESAKNQGFAFNAAGNALRRIFPSRNAYWNFLQAAKACIPPPLRPLAKRAIAGGIPELGADDRAFVLDYFRERNAKLETLIGISLEHWQR